METVDFSGRPEGEETETWPEADQAGVSDVFARARAAFAAWGATSVRERVARLRDLRRQIVRDLDDVLRTLVESTGKPALEALSSDILVTLEMARYYERHAGSILRPERRPAGLLFAGSRFQVELSPVGVVVVIAPWNHPLQLALVPALTALVAGNAVVLKASELTPAVGDLIGTLVERAGFPEGVLQVVHGGPAVGEALVRARPDKIFFTGSTRTGRRIMELAARDLVPVELELGGKDPMIVFADANLERAARGAVYGAFANSGQSCIGVERLYVEDAAHDHLVALIRAEVKRLRLGSDGDLGPLIRPAQVEVVADQVHGAVERGARLETPFRIEGRFVSPVVLTGVDHRMAVMTEETFGPVLPIMRFGTEDEAVALANDSRYGLNASVWTADRDRGLRVARRLVGGNCAVNDVLRNAGNPAMPFGGERHSGFGRYHGPEGLRAFSRQRSLQIARGRRGREPGWLPFDAATAEGLKGLLVARHGPGAPPRRAWRLARASVRAARAWWRERGGARQPT